ncbi:polymer-forming cytoskeletal protein [Salinivibrio sp. ES.052]|uniref:bactofilin family protein n=1 Tax=Salinivibrio sp. ES.052 TaxID=1882823 RepID=UPI00094106DC|nr:polymer-forming cytoskeletal protein [Salinivibrio sp. ES.052]
MGLFNSKSHPNHSLSIIARNCKVVGDIELEGDIQIDGFGEGNITQANAVVISASGHFRGTIHAKHITVNGLVEGQCDADAIDILSQGKMKGVLNTEQLTIEKGGLLAGENRATLSTDTVVPLADQTRVEAKQNKDKKPTPPSSKQS